MSRSDGTSGRHRVSAPTRVHASVAHGRECGVGSAAAGQGILGGLGVSSRAGCPGGPPAAGPNLPEEPAPAATLLDPDGGAVHYLSASGAGQRHPGWACYHTGMRTIELDGVEVRIMGLAVEAPFAVLVTEQPLASNARIMVSVASARQVAPLGQLPRLVVIDRVLRYEGTSLHCVPPSMWASLEPRVLARLDGALDGLGEPLSIGSARTTDVRYPENEAAWVEMNAAALYPYATQRTVVCFTHIANTMATDFEDF